MSPVFGRSEQNFLRLIRGNSTRAVSQKPRQKSWAGPLRCQLVGVPVRNLSGFRAMNCKAGGYQIRTTYADFFTCTQNSITFPRFSGATHTTFLRKRLGM